MKAAIHALREIRAAGLATTPKPGLEPLHEVAGLLSGASLGSVAWLLLYGLAWFR